MKNALSIVSTLCIGFALALAACGKEKKPAAVDPAAVNPAQTDPAKTDPAAAEPKPDDKPNADNKGGW